MVSLPLLAFFLVEPNIEGKPGDPNNISHYTLFQLLDVIYAYIIYTYVIKYTCIYLVYLYYENPASYYFQITNDTSRRLGCLSYASNQCPLASSSCAKERLIMVQPSDSQAVMCMRNSQGSTMQNLIQWVWGGAQNSVFITSFWVMLISLVCRQH